MRFSLSSVLITIAVIFFLIVLIGTAASMGFFGNMFDGFFGGMFGDMFGSTVESVTGSGSSSTSGSTSGSSRPLPTPTVRR